MTPDDQNLALQTVDGAAKAGVLMAAASVVSGLALASTPVKVLGLVAIASTTSVSWPIVAAVGATGAVAGGASALLRTKRRQKRVEEQFQALLDD